MLSSEETPGFFKESTSLLSPQEQKVVNSFFLITTKPVIYCANIGENEIGKEDNNYDLGGFGSLPYNYIPWIGL